MAGGNWTYMNDLKQTLIDLGISQGEFAKLVGVSRVTVGWWCNARHQPNKWTRPVVDRVLERLESARADGSLAALDTLANSTERLELLRALTLSQPA